MTLREVTVGFIILQATTQALIIMTMTYWLCERGESVYDAANVWEYG